MENETQYCSLRVILDETVVLEKNREYFVWGSVDCDEFRIKEGIFVGYKDKLANLDILLANSIVSVDKDGKIPIRLYNLSDSERKIHKGTSMGSLEILERKSEFVRNIFSKKSDASHVKPLIERIEKEADIPLEHKKSVKKLILKYAHVFSESDTDIGYCTKIKHHIVTREEVPIAIPPRRIPIGIEDKVDKLVEDLLEKNIIRKSESPWNAPLVIITKANGDIRLCVDYRQLNLVTVRPIYPIPETGQLFDALSGAKIFSVLDLSNGYYNVEVNEADKEKTAFSTRRGQYEFNRMPFGLSSAPATFQRLMHLILQNENWEQCLIYLDDVLIFGNSYEQHLSRLEKVLARIEDSGVKLKPDKCNFLLKEVSYLGHKITEEGIKTDPIKIEKVKNWSEPGCFSDLHSFIAFCNYYRKFIKDFGYVVQPLETILKQDKQKINGKYSKKQIIWNDEGKKAFKQIKELLTTAPVLAYPLREGMFILDTDASHSHIGGILSQVQNGDEKVIAYTSKKLTNSELKYCVTRKELLAVYVFVKQFRHYLLGRCFKIRTDHKALIWLKNWKNPNTSQYFTWITELEEYDFTIEHRPGRCHINADYMSRPECEQCELRHDEPKKRRNIKLVEKKNDENQIIRILEEDYTFQRKNKIMEYYHNNMGHPGFEKTKELIQKFHNWKDMNKEIKMFVEKCIPCLKRKNGILSNCIPKKHFEANEVFEKICIDITGPLPECKGYRYILGVIDVFSRYIMLIPLKGIKSKQVINKLFKRWIAIFGMPKIIHSDNGSQFRNNFMEDFCKVLKINQTFASPYYHQGNGLVERIFRTAKDRIYATSMKFVTSWVDAIPFVEMGMRMTKSEATNYPPFEVVFGKQIQAYVENRENSKNVDQYLGIIRANLERINENLRPKEKVTINSNHQIKAGDMVMFKSEKKGILKKRYKGPCQVTEILPYDNIEMSYKGRKLIRNINQIKKYKLEKSEYKAECSIKNTTIISKSEKSPVNKPRQLAADTQERRYPIRERHKPSRFRKFN